MKIQPLSDRILVKREEQVKKLASGLIIPDTTSDKPRTGKVLAVGPGSYSSSGERIPLSVSVGDTIIFTKNAGEEVTFEDEDYIIMFEREILAKVNS